MGFSLVQFQLQLILRLCLSLVKLRDICEVRQDYQISTRSCGSSQSLSDGLTAKAS